LLALVVRVIVTMSVPCGCGSFQSVSLIVFLTGIYCLLHNLTAEWDGQ
jgi:hypothetical protein